MLLEIQNILIQYLYAVIFLKCTNTKGLFFRSRAFQRLKFRGRNVWKYFFQFHKNIPWRIDLQTTFFKKCIYLFQKRFTFEILHSWFIFWNDKMKNIVWGPIFFIHSFILLSKVKGSDERIRMLAFNLKIF